jgi:NADH-quinone oxidoreductase subunit L
MGGLKGYLPITYWTFVIGSLAIAGVPGLAGFFSKDEILYETFREGHWILWTMAAITSLLTATYMFRLVFLTFHGDTRFAPHAAPSHPAPSHVAPGDLHLHDAPPAMALVLVVLAIGSAVAGYVGVPHALGGHNLLAEWLAPSFQPPAVAVAGGLQASGAIAVAGIGLAAFVWLRRRGIADAMAARFTGVYRLLLNKYYVDELYNAVVVTPIRIGSERGLWRGFDVGVIDGAVNGTASLVSSSSDVLRRVQTGSVRAYAGSMFIGVVVILGYYLWR